jgi:hypothetical protein
VVYLPANEDVIEVRVIDARRPGIVTNVRIYDRHSRRLLRESPS